MNDTLDFPVVRLSAALSKGLTPGFHGQVKLSFRLIPEALDGVVMETTRIASLKPGGEPPPAAGRVDTSLRSVAERISRQAKLQFCVRSITAHFRDGRLMQYEIEDSP